MSQKIRDEIQGGIYRLSQRAFEPNQVYIHPDMERKLKTEINPHSIGAPPTIHGADIIVDASLPEGRIVVADDSIFVEGSLFYPAGIEIIDVELS